MRAICKGYPFENGIMSEENLKEIISLHSRLTSCNWLINTNNTVLQRPKTAYERELLYSNNIKTNFNDKIVKWTHPSHPQPCHGAII